MNFIVVWNYSLTQKNVCNYNELSQHSGTKHTSTVKVSIRGNV